MNTISRVGRVVGEFAAQVPDVDVDQVVVAHPGSPHTASMSWRRLNTTPGREDRAARMSNSVRVKEISSPSRNTWRLAMSIDSGPNTRGGASSACGSGRRGHGYGAGAASP